MEHQQRSGFRERFILAAQFFLELAYAARIARPCRTPRLHAEATESRVVHGTVADVRARVTRFLGGQLMQIKRNLGEPGQIWEPSADFWSSMRRYVLVLVAILITGTDGKPIALPRPVVNTIRLQPPAASPVRDTGSYPGVFMKTNPGDVTRSA